MKFFKNKLAVATVALSVAFLAAIGYSASQKQEISALNVVGNMLGHVNGFIYNAGTTVKDKVGSVSNFAETKKENEELRKEVLELQLKLGRYQTLKTENETLRQQLQYKDKRQEFDYIGCDVLSKGTAGTVETFIINKGSRDGLMKGLTVIAGEDLVGQITAVYDSYSEIQTIGSENIAVAAYTISTKNTAGATGSIEYSGILKGYKTNKLSEVKAKIEQVELKSPVEVGDVALTSGQGLVYPKDLRIGEVTSVEEDKGRAMKTIYIKPFLDFDNLQQLLVVIPKDPIPTEGNIQYKGK
ncbi:rod shape-determining protein MreC [Clostridium cellulovorans]|uniref:Cell shape-determining protein MreC n=1 Tax=Clostridium cellulovorans (strain ATCC 35296 / DSM 3052 / OCM 3 / 743B) TaxID=573061 RepID=D9SS17_CLOC7|nr:rod shape-determining protein MreC [Clostridium cellulovorans]ADL52464.1 rod shape-determining protein MreC [Clostridium cellulovorans 743B]